VVDGLFAVEFRNPAVGSVVVIEASNDLVTWTPVHTNNTPTITFSEATDARLERFFRAVVKP
jgi:hypothetical protein